MQYKRLYISADIEGVTGVVTSEQANKTGFEFQLAREWMTNEVNAVCEAAFEAGIEEIVVSDSHGTGQNLLLDQLPKSGVQVVRSWPRPLGMMEGIDQHFDGAVLLGYHTSANHERGLLAHTFSGVIRDIRLNGNSASESVVSAAIASHFNVPVILATGDDAYTEHVEDVFDDIEVATVKWAYSSTSARTLLPHQGCALIAEKTTAALKRLQDFKPYQINTPIKVEVDFIKRKPVETLCYLPELERISATALAFEADDMVEVSRILKGLYTCGGALLK